MPLVIAGALAAIVVSGLYVIYQDRPITPAATTAANGPIYFITQPDRASGGRAMFAVEGNGTDFKQIPLPNTSIVSLAVSPDARWIAVSTGGFDTLGDVGVMRLDGTGYRRLTSDGPIIGAGGHADIQPAWSPDSAWIVFASTRCCDTEHSLGSYALHVMRPDGTGERRLTAPQGAWSPAWSPDGSLIAYTADLRALWVIGSDGSSPRALIPNGERFIKASAWSPDGREIAFATQGPGSEQSTPYGSVPEDFQIRVIRRDGTGERTIYRCADLCRFGGYAVGWSPDGKEIAFVFGRKRGGGIAWHIGLVAPDGSGFRVLDTHGMQPSDFSWTATKSP